MKFEFEISEEEIRKSIERDIRTAVNERVNDGLTMNFIRERVKTLWPESVHVLVSEALEDSSALRSQIAEEVERKLRAQIAVALKMKSKS